MCSERKYGCCHYCDFYFLFVDMFYSNVAEHIFDVGNPESERYFVGGIPKFNFLSPIPSYKSCFPEQSTLISEMYPEHLTTYP